MAPAAIENENQQRPAETSIDYSKTEYKYAAYLPYYTPGLQPPLQEAVEITPNIETELFGIQLSSLTSAQKDDLALLAAERGVVVFRDQDFANIGPERQREFGRHFGPLHIHQMGGHIKDYPETLPVYRDFVSGAVDNEISNKQVEPICRNGMGTTIFYPLEVPLSGGDTLYLSTTAAYEHLSEDFRSRIEGLSATHSGFSQAAVHDHRERYIREPIETVHPVVRTHPVCIEEKEPVCKPAVYEEDSRMEGGGEPYVSSFIAMKTFELMKNVADAILNFLYDHIEKGQDGISASTGHLAQWWCMIIGLRSTLRDFKVQEAKTRRHMVQITPQAERPYFEK
ncbi:hypothetical protein BDW72DRAFT_198578 [Aspergillus terricola var. indicus]